MKANTLIPGLSIFLLFQACAGNSNPTAEKSGTAETLVGKTAKITYPDFSAEVQYLNDSTVHWKAIDQTGKTNEGTEHISYKQLNPHLYFLNWIEKDGLTVSQVINTKDGEVDAFLSYKDDKSPAGRAAQFVKGKFEFNTKK
jgi:hypothetical protein